MLTHRFQCSQHVLPAEETPPLWYQAPATLLIDHGEHPKLSLTELIKPLFVAERARLAQEQLPKKHTPGHQQRKWNEERRPIDPDTIRTPIKQGRSRSTQQYRETHHTTEHREATQENREPSVTAFSMRQSVRCETEQHDDYGSVTHLRVQTLHGELDDEVQRNEAAQNPAER
jgi:hypothetical protein